MVLGRLPVPGHPIIWNIVGQGPTALAVGAGGGCLDIFTLIYPFFPLSPSLWETARYRLKYCLKGPLNPKQPTNQPIAKNLPLPLLSLTCLLLISAYGSFPSGMFAITTYSGSPSMCVACFRDRVYWLVGCFGLNGPLRQYFSLYRVVSQREGERKEK